MANWLYGAAAPRTFSILVAACVACCAMRGDSVERRHPAPSTRSGTDEPDAARKRVREGATLEGELGEFREAGERIRFYLSDEKTSFVAIENLALERISRVLDENTSPRTWSVSGVVTEYRGGNYLIITRAALKARSKRIAGAAAHR